MLGVVFMRKIVLLFGCCVLLLVIFGCSSTGQMIVDDKKTEKEPAKTGIINENYNPTLFDENELKIQKTISPESKSDNFDDLLLQSPKEAPLPEETDGFRVQICAVVDEIKAKQVQRDAIMQFINEEVYLDYHAPYYKVRIGNCLTRYEAEQLQQIVIKKDFADAWVVRAKIKPNLKKNESSPENENAPPNESDVLKL